MVSQKACKVKNRRGCIYISGGNTIKTIKNNASEVQEYLLDGNKNSEVSRFIFRARSMTLNIKTQKSWKYSDMLCVGCGVNSETGDEILSCKELNEGENEEYIQTLFYDMFYSGKTSEMSEVAKILMKRLKVRDKILEEQEQESN